MKRYIGHSICVLVNILIIFLSMSFHVRGYAQDEPGIPNSTVSRKPMISVVVGNSLEIQTEYSSGKTIWTSSDTKIATVKKGNGSKGIITGIKKGICVICAKSNGMTEYRTVQVNSALQVEKEVVSIEKGEKESITITSFLTQGSFDYSISNQNVNCSLVQENGDTYKLVVEGQRVGKTTITVYDTYNEQIKITVTVWDESTAKDVVYRALVIGESRYPESAMLQGAVNDAYAMKRVLKKTGYTTVKSKMNASKSSVKSLISSTFGKADSNDVSLFYFSGHGSSDGSLVAINQSREQEISTKELAKWLGAVEGHVIVILDCCNSGKVINRAGRSLNKNENEFNNSIIRAFVSRNEITRAGELRNGKFQVLVSSAGNQNSLEYKKKGIFTSRLIKGIGYQYGTGNKKAKAPADTNMDGKLSLKECWEYTKIIPKSDTEYYEQISQCYPQNSNFVIFRR